MWSSGDNRVEISKLSSPHIIWVSYSETFTNFSFRCPLLALRNYLGMISQTIPNNGRTPHSSKMIPKRSEGKTRFNAVSFLMRTKIFLTKSWKILTLWLIYIQWRKIIWMQLREKVSGKWTIRWRMNWGQRLRKLSLSTMVSCQRSEKSVSPMSLSRELSIPKLWLIKSTLSIKSRTQSKSVFTK